MEARDAWSATTIDALFEGWYLAEDDGPDEGAPSAIVMRGGVIPARIPPGLAAFEVAGGGTCYTDGAVSFIDIDGSVVAVGQPGLAPVEIWPHGTPAVESPSLTRLVSYALAAALRQRRLFQLHSAALVDQESGKGVLIVGKSGSGKSTVAVHLAAAGWPFLTDDVLLLGRQSGGSENQDPPYAGKPGSEMRAWPLRRCFSITETTFAVSRWLQERTSLDKMVAQADDKRQFLPHTLFGAAFRDHCVPGMVFFSELTGTRDSRVMRLSKGETMTRLIRMNPWSCYERTTATEHLAVLSALAAQCTGYSLLAGRDLLDSDRSVELIASYARTQGD